MSDRFVEVTNQSWLSRIGGAIKGIFFGFVLIIIGIGLLFWNEGRAVKTHRALVESQAQVATVNAQEILPAMNGKLVHISGEATTNEVLADDLLPVSATALKLRRDVETYQWEENSTSEENKKVGGSTETVTTYEYRKVWTSQQIDSSNFKQQAGHENPDNVPYESQTWTAGEVAIGAYTLSSAHKNKINNFEPHKIPEAALPEGVSRQGQQLYYGVDPKKPQIGDQRIGFQVVLPQTYSAVGSLSGSQLTAHTASNGRSIALVQAGSHTADAMFEQAKNENSVLTWIVRAIGSIILIIAFSMILRPLSVVADVIPFIGNIVEMGTSFVAFILGIVVALVTVCIAWIVYRPLLGLALLLVVAALIYWLRSKSKSVAQAQVAALENSAGASSPAL